MRLKKLYMKILTKIKIQLFHTLKLVKTQAVKNTSVGAIEFLPNS